MPAAGPPGFRYLRHMRLVCHGGLLFEIERTNWYNTWGRLFSDPEARYDCRRLGRRVHVTVTAADGSYGSLCWCIHKGRARLRQLVRVQRLWRARAAVGMALHPRLGAASGLGLLPEVLLRAILDLAQVAPVVHVDGEGEGGEGGLPPELGGH